MPPKLKDAGSRIFEISEPIAIRDVQILNIVDRGKTSKSKQLRSSVLAEGSSIPKKDIEPQATSAPYPQAIISQGEGREEMENVREEDGLAEAKCRPPTLHRNSSTQINDQLPPNVTPNYENSLPIKPNQESTTQICDLTPRSKIKSSPGPHVFGKSQHLGEKGQSKARKRRFRVQKNLSTSRRQSQGTDTMIQWKPNKGQSQRAKSQSKPRASFAASKISHSKNSRKSAWSHERDLSDVNRFPIPVPKWTGRPTVPSSPKLSEGTCDGSLQLSTALRTTSETSLSARKQTLVAIPVPDLCPSLKGQKSSSAQRTASIRRCASIIADDDDSLLEDTPDYSNLVLLMDKEEEDEQDTSPYMTPTPLDVRLAGFNDENNVGWNFSRLRRGRDTLGNDMDLSNGPVLQSIETDEIRASPSTPNNPYGGTSGTASLESQQEGIIECEVSRIVGERIGPDIHAYLVEWVGYPGRAWILVENCACPDKIEEFRTQQQKELLAARQDGQHAAVRRLQRLAEAGEARELDTFKFPNTPGWAAYRRNANGKFQALGLGNSILEVVRLPTVSPQSPQNVRQNTAILPATWPSASPPDQHTDSRDDEVIWIRTDAILETQEWPRDHSKHVKGEFTDQVLNTERHLSFVDRSEETEQSELERETSRDHAEDARKRAADLENAELIRISEEIERKKKDLDEAQRKKSAMEFLQRDRDRLGIFKHAKDRKEAQQQELERTVLNQCTNHLRPSIATAGKQPQGSISVTAREPKKEKSILQRLSQSNNEPQLNTLPTTKQRASEDIPPHRKGGRTATNRTSTLPPGTSKVQKMRGERSQSSMRRSMHSHDLEDAFRAEAKRKAAEPASVVRSEFRSFKGAKQVEHLISQARGALPPASFY